MCCLLENMYNLLPLSIINTFFQRRVPLLAGLWLLAMLDQCFAMLEDNVAALTLSKAVVLKVVSIVLWIRI